MQHVTVRSLGRRDCERSRGDVIVLFDRNVVPSCVRLVWSACAVDFTEKDDGGSPAITLDLSWDSSPECIQGVRVRIAPKGDAGAFADAIREAILLARKNPTFPSA